MDMDKALAKVQAGALSGAAALVVGQHLDSMDKSLDSEVLSRLGAGTLSPEGALAAWHEKAAYRKLRRRLLASEAEGRRAGAELQPLMDGAIGHAS